MSFEAAMPENTDRAFRIALNEMRLQSQLCDVTLIADDGSQLSAHRAVLAATSPFFRQRFAAPLKSTAADDVEDNAHFPLPGIAAATLSIVVEYLYTGCVRTTGATVHALLDAAARLQLPALRDTCLQSMCTHLLRPDTCLALRRLARCHDGSGELCNHVDAYIRQHCHSMVLSPQFDELIDAMPVEEAVRLLTVADTAVAQVDVSSSIVGKAVQRPQVLMVVNIQYSQCYDFDERRWFDVKKSKIGSYHPMAAFVHDNMVYIIPFRRDHISVYNTVTRTWKREHFPLYNNSTYRGTVTMKNDRIYILGGMRALTATDETVEYLDRVDVYDVRAQRWQKMAPMLSDRYECSAIVVDGRLYAVGGCNGQYLATAERYDPATNTWEAIASMLEPRRFAVIAELNGQVYIMGGIGPLGHTMKSVEVYDPLSNTWHRLPHMMFDYRDPVVVAHAGELYVMNRKGDRNVEVFSPGTNKWRQLLAPIPDSEYFGVMCVFDKPDVSND